MTGAFLWICLFELSDKTYKFAIMKEKSHNLEEPAVSYGNKVRLGEIEFKPMPRMMESLRDMGYISFDELSERLTKRL